MYRHIKEVHRQEKRKRSESEKQRKSEYYSKLKKQREEQSKDTKENFLRSEHAGFYLLYEKATFRTLTKFGVVEVLQLFPTFSEDQLKADDIPVEAEADFLSLLYARNAFHELTLYANHVFGKL